MEEFPWSLVEAALLGDADVELGVPCRFRDTSHFGWASDHQPISGAEFRSAVDRRSFETLRTFHTPDYATALVRLHGRQLGTLGRVVPTGRTFSTLGQVLVVRKSSEATEIIVESGWLGELTGSRVQLVPRFSLARAGVSAERADLLAGDVTATFWARSWGLPPRLARLAVLLMAGLPPTCIAERASLSLRSVRTYTEELLASAGIHSRSELVPAALRDGLPPRR